MSIMEQKMQELYEGDEHRLKIMYEDKERKRLGITITNEGSLVKVDSEKYNNHKPYQQPFKTTKL